MQMAQIHAQAEIKSPRHASRAPLFRLALRPSAGTGLRSPSQVMIDKMISIKRERLSQVIGRADGAPMQREDRALKTWLGVD
jgi:mRNA interferase MazF